ncbi:hypothetical protein POF53_17305 [Mitsuaria sp. RG]|nr:hypothetical protein [Mitsuaria sp. RG]
MSRKADSSVMPILDLELSNTTRFEASRFLDHPKTIAAFLAEAMQSNDAQALTQAIGEVAKTIDANQLTQDASGNRESL